MRKIFIGLIAASLLLTTPVCASTNEDTSFNRFTDWFATVGKSEKEKRVLLKNRRAARKIERAKKRIEQQKKAFAQKNK